MSFERESDLWFRRMAIVGPIVTFIIGWGSGVLTAALMYRDHEKRIVSLERFRDDQFGTHSTITSILSAIQEHIKIDEKEYQRHR
jgi:hypothetical protein